MANLQFALDELGHRIIPFAKGKGFCPVCKGAMIAKCGDIYRWHWQHVRELNCDSWKEHETIWHRKWKEKFPAECREVILQHNGEKHIADVLTKSGVVIEFQNSSISAGTILIREAFYDYMIWVINAKPFSDNFKIKSTVTQKLWKLDRSHKFDENRKFDQDWRLDDFDRKIKSLTHELNIFKDNAANGQRKLKSLESAQEGLADLVTQVLASWKSYRTTPLSIHGFALIADSLKVDFLEKTQKIRAVKAELNEAQKKLTLIQNMEPYLYLGVSYVITAFEDLKLDLIDRCIIISKADKDTMFPTVLKFRSEHDFHTYKYKISAYLFAINPTLTLNRLNGDLARLQDEHQLLTAGLPDYRVLLTQRFIDFLQNELKVNEERFYNAAEKQSRVQSKIYTEEIERANYNEKVEEWHVKSIKEDQAKYEAEKSRIMKIFKGQYSFVWKRERKSWSETLCRVYFDFGNEYLFERTSADSLVKVPISEFLARHL
jgi:competence CoiA-like predicted nuclease